MWWGILLLGSSGIGSAFATAPSAPLTPSATAVAYTGPFQKEMGEDSVWTGHEEIDPVLAVYRVERVKFPDSKTAESGGNACADAVKKLAAKRLASPGGVEAWSPFDEDARDLVVSCTSFPCKVKLNEKEVESLKNTPAPARINRYRDLVTARVMEARKTGKREGYERPEPALDGWTWLRKRRDFGLAPPASGEVLGRTLDLAKKGGYLDIRQVIEQRSIVVQNATENRVHLWTRDLYTDHYFDSWSEEVDLTCLSPSEGIFAQTMVIEIDLLKNTDFFAKMMKPKLRHGVREAVLGIMKERREEWF